MTTKPRQSARARTERHNVTGPGFREPRPCPRRSNWDDYFMRLAREVATRSTCDRKHVGAVVVRDRMILTTGYNGSVRGLPHCRDVGCMMVDGHCARTIHAEANALVQAARNGVRVAAADIYITASPCLSCLKLIANAGLRRVVFGEFYQDERVFELAGLADIELVRAELSPTCELPVGPSEDQPQNEDCCGGTPAADMPSHRRTDRT